MTPGLFRLREDEDTTPLKAGTRILIAGDSHHTLLADLLQPEIRAILANRRDR